MKIVRAVLPVVTIITMMGELRDLLELLVREELPGLLVRAE